MYSNAPFEFEDARNIEAAVFQALGAASACWEHIQYAGTFDEARAKSIGAALLARIAEEVAQYSDGGSAE